MSDEKHNPDGFGCLFFVLLLILFMWSLRNKECVERRMIFNRDGHNCTYRKVIEHHSPYW